MEETIKYIGYYTYYDDKYTVDMIDWINGIRVQYDMDYLATDGWSDYENNIEYEYVEISNKMFDILSKSILNKPISKIDYFEPSVSELSTFIFQKNNKIYELIIDEANLEYIIKIFNSNKKEDSIYPFECLSYFLKGLDAAGFKKIEVVFDKNNERKVLITDFDNLVINVTKGGN